MPDYFALLNEPRRPWLDAELLKQTFLALASAFHPDRVHHAGEPEKSEATKHYAELNAAYQCLREPKSRLLHLLELESGVKPKEIQTIPPALADLFAEVATTCRSADDFLTEKAQATSPLVQAQLFTRGQEWVDALQTLRQTLGDVQAQLNTRLAALDERWLAADAAARRELLPKLEELFRLFSYFNRWHNQIQERLVQLSF